MNQSNADNNRTAGYLDVGLSIDPERKQYSALIARQVNERGIVQVMDDGFRIFSVASAAPSGAQRWEIHFGAIKSLSLIAPHIVLQSQKGEILQITFDLEAEREEILTSLVNIELAEIAASQAAGLDGLDARSAATFTQHLASELAQIAETLSVKEAHVSSAKLYRGLAYLVTGVSVTAVTYWIATTSPGGGTYIVAWGAMLVGAILSLTGLIGWMRRKFADGGAAKNLTPTELRQAEDRLALRRPDIRSETSSGECPNCHKEIPIASKSCEYCSASFDSNSSWRVKRRQ